MNIRRMIKTLQAMNRKPLREGRIANHEPARWIATLAARIETLEVGELERRR